MATPALVITTEPNRGLLTDALIDAVIAPLPEACRPIGLAWLGAGEAVDIPLGGVLNGDELKETLEALRANAAGLPADVNLIEAGPGRRKQLLIADMDSTIIQQECIDEIAAFAGIGERVAGITERAMRGELDFEAALTERVGLLAGFDETALLTVYETRIALTPGAQTLVATMKANGAYSALVSGGFTFFTSRIAALTGFQENRANVLEIAGGRLTGRVAPPILGREAKLQSLNAICAARGIATGQALAVGDGANDLAMIRQAGLGVAFRAKPVVAAEAGAAIVHGDLTALLYLQGYSRGEFVEVNRNA